MAKKRRTSPLNFYGYREQNDFDPKPDTKKTVIVEKGTSSKEQQKRDAEQDKDIQKVSVKLDNFISTQTTVNKNLTTKITQNKNAIDAINSKLITSGEYDETTEMLIFKNSAGTTVFEVDLSDIPGGSGSGKDKALEDVQVEHNDKGDTILVFRWNADANNKTVEINLTSELNLTDVVTRGDVEQMIEDATDDIYDAIDDVSRKTDVVSGAVDILEDKTDAISGSLVDIGDRVDAIGASVDDLVSKTDIISGSLEDVADRVVDVEDSVEDISSKTNAVSGSVDNVIDVIEDVNNVIEDIADATEALSGKVEDIIEETFTDVEYDSDEKKIIFKNELGETVGELDATPFITDGMVDSVTYDQETKELVIVFNTDSGKEEVRISLDDLFTLEAGDGTEVDGNKVSVKLDNSAEDTEKFLSVSEDGLMLSGITEAIEEAQYFKKPSDEEIAEGTLTVLKNSNGTEIMKISEDGEIFIVVEGQLMSLNDLVAQLAHETY